MKAYLQEQLKSFDRGALWSNEAASEGVKVVAGWAIPAFFFVLLVSHLASYRPVSYLEKAVAEGIGPHLWNVIGTLGLVLVAISLLLPGSRFLAKSAYQVLINTYAIGGLSFGLLFGQLAAAVATSNTESWLKWVVGLGGLALAVQVLFLNFSLWYLGHLMASREKSDGFLHRVEKVHLRGRVVAALIVGGIPAILLCMEK